jgi:hypothetical protein
MKLKELKKNFFQIPDYDLEFQGSKNPYEYFNIINEKCEKASLFANSILNGELLRAEPLEYRFISNGFPNNRNPDAWKTRIDVMIEKTSTGSVFYIQPKAGAALWVIVLFIVFAVLFNLFAGNYEFFLDFKIMLFPGIIVGFYFIERFNIRRLIDKFKKEVI